MNEIPDAPDKFDENDTIYLTPEALEQLSAYTCPRCGGYFTADEKRDQLKCPHCGLIQTAVFQGVEPGEIIGGYRVLRGLASGATGSLFLCCQAERPETEYVLKLLKGEAFSSSEARSRFVREAELLAQLRHDNIVRCCDFFQDERNMYMVMEYVRGYDLTRMVQENFYFPCETGLELLYVLADAFKYAWDELHLLHRDIKPGNVMVDGDGVVKILDFGLAKSMICDSALTAVGQVIGSPGFMSPEQFRDAQSADCRSDIFSLGATIYFVMSGGQLPYAGKTPAAVYMNTLSQRPQKLSHLNAEVPTAFSDLIERMLAPNPADRPDSWDELLAEIERIAK